MASTEREPISGVQKQSPWWSGRAMPPEADSLSAFAKSLLDAQRRAKFNRFGGFLGISALFKVVQGNNFRPRRQEAKYASTTNVSSCAEIETKCHLLDS